MGRGGALMRKQAVALRYRQSQERAPRVVAKGAGAVAEALLRQANTAGVPVHVDPQLTGALMQLEVDAVIPEELYAAVAEVLAYVYRERR
ncbi:MAG: EscU/YscU/HrcU family type III secretion system export apparatus switch protein [Alicyclobacillus sp.]|nr:EscU/YscU/HrcU family type III secretion system export apparatus switch protein [Alicyclobacillus sp.]